MSTATRLRVALAALLCASSVAAQSDREPGVSIAWNRLYDYDGVVELCNRLAEAHPDLCKVSVLGHSVEGRAMPLLTIMNPATGDESTKSAMWIDGNVHGNEVQGGEACLYLVWTLLERYGDLPSITELVDERVFYVLPMVNPDGRQYWFEAPNTPHSSRSGKEPTDEDGDGLYDEDGPDDLDGDGELLRMRKHVAPGTGTHRISPDDPRIMEMVPREKRVELGADWLLLGTEGYDNDGDGEVNEDGPGGYDMNRNWPAGWMPKYIQYGAGDHPFSWPETEAIGRFILAHPNIAAVQSFHNSGGMILRGPGTAARNDFYPSADAQVYDAIGKEGEAILPHYRSMVIYKDLYEVHGGFVDWTAEGLGIISFTNELWADSQYFDEDIPRRGEGEAKRLQFDDDLMFGETFVPWHEVEHPQYGTIEVGGFKKMTGRTPPTFMIEEMLHRNAAFTLFHARQMPKVSVESLEVAPGPGGLRYVTLVLRNDRWIPSRTAVSADKGIGRPDLLTLTGDDVTVVAGGPGADRFDPTRFLAVEHEPERLRLDRGIPGHGTERIRWLVRGTGRFTVRYDSWKAGTLEVSGDL
ncbi:MAG: peptidase M14 [Planctomycetes bacterium]|nr:peptidase M14 [Planctomycetota bacterium]